MTSRRTILSRSSALEPRQSVATGIRCEGTRRGRRLTSAHHKTLLDLCMSNKSGEMLANHKKRFWKHISALLLPKTGRLYSWQSCRRQATKWESQQSHAQNLPRDTAAAPEIRFEAPGPPAPHGSIALPPISHLNLCVFWPAWEPPLEDSSDDEMLPAVNLPPVRTRSHQASTLETFHSDLNSPVLTAMQNFEVQLRVLTSTLADQNIHVLAIENAFQNLKLEISNSSVTHNEGP
ncbi:hypothetical protein N7478_001330 [Penicillium angulare]|uniref:uncharacterized protein n=1 Tax=Penicillium angulare TaxID=116970 RepID=UPI0025422E50|nr:uncharacterized protein N7478_001330 [Penicillium angulare]KAJ5292079.1 hypothetical protein N7478_001330 [Penicillium angulare]